MALQVKTGTLTQPGSTGNATISGLDNPKAIVMWTSPLAAAGTGAHMIFGMGFGTYRSSTVSQRYIAVSSEDNAATSDTYASQFTDALLVCHDGTTGAEDLQIELVSMDSTSVTINYSNLFTTASVLIHYIIFGGSDVTDALVGNWTAGTTDTTDDVTVVSGFGKPELVFFFTTDNDFSTATAWAGADPSFGWAKQGEAGRSVTFASDDAQAAAAKVDQAIHNNRAGVAREATTPSSEGTYRLDTTVSNWPTDGFRVLYDANPVWAMGIGYLALRLSGNVTVTTGEGSAPIAGGLPVVQTLTAGGGTTPRGLIVLNARTATANTFDVSSANDGMIGIGAYDGTTECWAGITDDDALGTQNANRQIATTKAIRYYDMSSTPALTSEADGAVSGADFQLSWNDIDATAFLYEWLSLTETTAQSVSITAATETDSAQDLRVPRLTAATEADTAQAVTFTKTIFVTLGVAAETDTAQALSITKTIFVSILTATETDTAQAVTYSQAGAHDISPALETDSAQALRVPRLTAATETDTAQALDADKAVSVTQATETDSAQALTFTKTILVSLTLATETDSAVALTISKTLGISTASETDTAGALRAPQITAAAETDTAGTLTFSQPGANNIAPGTETDSAQALTFTKTIFVALTPALETDSAVALSVAHLRAITLASETDTAQALTRAKAVSLVTATETDVAQALSITKTIFMALGLASETDTAVLLTFLGGVPIVGYFDPPSPASGHFGNGTPASGAFDVPTPSKVLA